MVTSDIYVSEYVGNVLIWLKIEVETYKVYVFVFALNLFISQIGQTNNESEEEDYWKSQIFEIKFRGVEIFNDYKNGPTMMHELQ